MNVFWFIPTHGDSRYLGTAEGGRLVSHDYMKQVAVAADTLGYDGVLLPTGRSCEDAWVTAASLIDATRQLKFLVAVRPGLTAPTLSARMAATFDRLSGGRLLINVVTGGDPVEQESDGIFGTHQERYEISEEFLKIWREVLSKTHSGGETNFSGKHLSVKGAKALYPPLQKPYPPLYFGGSSDEAIDLAAEQVDVYLTWGEPPAAVAEKIAKVRARAAKAGRTLRFGIRLHVIVRETNEAAWRAADELISKLDVSPNLWAGVGLVRGGAGTALVGDAKTVAARMQEYADLGIDTFVLSGYPHLEESYRFAELVFPLLPRKQKETLPGFNLTGPFGEIVGNTHVPPAAKSTPQVAAS